MTEGRISYDNDAYDPEFPWFVAIDGVGLHYPTLNMALAATHGVNFETATEWVIVLDHYVADIIAQARRPGRPL